jgi:alpha-beta hydrolase superfamily lysophospholipase
MEQATGTLIGQRGLKLVYGSWQPATKPKAVAIVVHGYGEHSGRYRHVSEALARRGYVVYTLDHRGHGGSDGVRAHVEHFDYFVDDLHQLSRKAHAAYPDLPIILIGHSMGGLIAIRYALRYQEQLYALVVSGAALQIGEDVSPVLRRMSRVLALIAPRLPIVGSPPGAESVLSRDPAVQDGFDHDPLCYTGKLRARMGYEMMRASIDARARMGQLRLPLLVMHGSEDRLANPQGSIDLSMQAGGDDKTLKLWQGCRHEIFNEPERDEVIGFMVNWMDRRLMGPPRPTVDELVADA